MAGPHDTPSHQRGFYPSVVSEKQRKEALAQVLRERKTRHDADEVERQRLSSERHAVRMQDFRDRIARNDSFTDEEKARIIKASYEW